MSTALTDTQILTSQILTVLNAANAIWDVCCGPNGNGVIFATLLSSLQTQYPEELWTSTQLSSVTLIGRRQGTLKEFTGSTFYLNAAMVQVNIRNEIYQVYSDKICGPRPLPRVNPILL